MNEQQRYLMFFRKFTFCRHKYSCFEHLLRTLYKTVALYLLVRVGIKFVFKDAVFEFFASKIRWLFGEGTSDKNIADAGLAIEINTILGMNLYLLRRCF